MNAANSAKYQSLYCLEVAAIFVLALAINSRILASFLTAFS
ncbi:hypothetical protein EVA_02204 [gut metagenome]|uniref:Uncharacterized protein n=1 Tax=gut metagenome TaxID=749906 RepID=J9DA02_9ZZZZ